MAGIYLDVSGAKENTAACSKDEWRMIIHGLKMTKLIFNLGFDRRPETDG